MLEEYEKTLEHFYEMLDGELSLPLRCRCHERIECIKGIIEDLAYAIKCMRPSDNYGYRPRTNSNFARLSFGIFCAKD